MVVANAAVGSVARSFRESIASWSVTAQSNAP